jgi:acid phosphatase class B
MDGQKFYFTFGRDQQYEGYCQPIVAKDYDTARAKMISMYGAKWAFQYTESQWNKTKNDPHRHRIEVELPEIVVREDICKICITPTCSDRDMKPLGNCGGFSR